MTIAASRWLHDVYDKVMALMPSDLANRLPPAEVFHEVLEHRWFMSEAAGRDIGTTAAARDYFEKVLPSVPEQLVAIPSSDLFPRYGEDTGSWLIDDGLGATGPVPVQPVPVQPVPVQPVPVQPVPVQPGPSAARPGPLADQVSPLADQVSPLADQVSPLADQAVTVGSAETAGPVKSGRRGDKP
jgi:hypothetical protein